MRAALALEMYSLSSFKLESMSFFSTEILPILDGIVFQHEVPEEANPGTQN